MKVLNAGGVEYMQAKVAEVRLHHRARRSAHTTVPKIGQGLMPRTKGVSASVRYNTSATGLACPVGVGTSGVKGVKLALLCHSLLPPTLLQKAIHIPWGLHPVPVVNVITCISDRTWTATPSELFGINTQVISRKLFDHDSAYWLESGSDLRRKHDKCWIITGPIT